MRSLTRLLLARAPGRQALLAVLALVSLASCMGPVPRHDGPPSDHFDGRRFFHEPPVNKGFFTFLRWRFTREPEGAWEADLAPPAVPPPPARVAGDAMLVTFVNHATVLIQTRGLNLLTDPIWSERASPSRARAAAPPAARRGVRRPAAHRRRADQPQPLRPHGPADAARLAERDDPLFLVPLANCIYSQGRPDRSAARNSTGGNTAMRCRGCASTRCRRGTGRAAACATPTARSGPAG
jgi:hypothetical protein